MREKWRGCYGQNVTMPFIISSHEATVVREFFMMRLRNPILPKTATSTDCVPVLQQASQKRNSQSQQRNDSARLLLRD